MFNSFIDKMDKLSSKLAEIPILILFLSYFFIIIIFAILFSCPFSKFFHSTVSFEDQVDKNASELSMMIEDQIIENLSHFIEENTFKYESWEINRNDIYVHIIEEDNKSILINLYVNVFYNYYLEETDMKYKRQYAGSRKLEIGLYDDRIGIGDNVYLPISFKKDSTIGIGDDRFDLNMLFYNPEIESTFKINIDQMTRLIKYHKTTQGFPSDFSDNILRMFYFSAVTITTLGYGDIVPLNNISRIR